MNSIKLIAVMLTILVIADIILFIFGKITGYLFWIVIIFCAIMAYFGIPYMKKKQQKAISS